MKSSTSPLAQAFVAAFVAATIAAARISICAGLASGQRRRSRSLIWARRDTPAWGPLFETLNPVNQSWAQRASALVMVVSRTQWVPPGKTEPAALGAHAFDTGAAWASLAFQAHLSGWQTHAIGGFDRDRARANLGIPADCAVHAVVAIGRRGDAAVLTDEQRAREQPNARHPLSTLVAEGRYAFD